MGTPEDIACAVSFFASEDAASSTGQRIVVERRRSLASLTIGTGAIRTRDGAGDRTDA